MAFVTAASAAIDGGLQVPEIARSHVLRWYRSARQRLSLEACLRNLEVRDFACTLLTAVGSTDGAAFSQLGDGAIVTDDGDGYQPIFWPQTGEYANTTNFLTGTGYEDEIVFRSVGHAVKDLALFTDGLQPLALHYASRTAHSPFFAPMFDSLRRTESFETLEVQLNEFLCSGAVNERTDDDKTLVLASRFSANGSA